VAQKADGEDHAGLTVRTDRGDFILDNLSGKVLIWKDTRYTYLKRQSVYHSELWVTIAKPRIIFVGLVSSAK